MASPLFFDSNVLVYADDQSSGAKLTIARNLLEQHVGDGTAVISLQVLQEYYAAATRKLGIAADQAQERARIMAEGPVKCFEAKDVMEAIDLHRLRQISFWDALIVHAARSAGAAVLYSDDLQHGAVLGGVRIENPFAVHN